MSKLNAYKFYSKGEIIEVEGESAMAELEKMPGLIVEAWEKNGETVQCGVDQEEYLEQIKAHWPASHNGDRLRYTALASTALAVAVVSPTWGVWRVYIAGVEGWNHDKEMQEVAKYGDKCSRALAEVLFPDLKGLVWQN